ncbi:MAG: HEAT repeat domain-containing protein [Planctomycetes bacterium]|nr:HEAT repeat domain-containing protein [Planctomycetota bacterium]
MDDNNHIIKILRTFSKTGNLVRVFDAQQALQPFGDETVSAMAEALKDPDADLRIFALKILEALGNKAEPALPAMIKALNDPDRIVKIAAIGPVAAFGEKAMDAVPILLKWIGSDDEFSHVTAIGHILLIDPSKADVLIPILVESLESNDFLIRCQTVWLLGQLGELTVEAVPALERMLYDDDSFVRSAASEALQEITGNQLP